MKGGKYLSKGSFGCVVKPAIGCKDSMSTENLGNYVSKIIREPDYHLNNEIDISNVLQKADPLKKYFITITKICKLDSIPDNRTNLAEAILLSKKKNNFTLTNSRSGIDKNKTCPLDLKKNPVNLIMPYGGYDLDKIIRYTKFTTTSKTMPKMVKLFIDNLKKNVKHLILGVINMHKNRVVHRDIKQGNILLDLDTTKTKLLIKYTDFGLSEFLTANYITKYENIHLRGTAQFYSPEIIAVKTIYTEWSHINNPTYVKNKFFANSDESNVKKLTVKVLEDNKLYNDYLNIRSELFDRIKQLFDSSNILPIYFGTDNNKFNGYLQKSDIYALGATIYNSLKEYIKYNDSTYTIEPLLKDLLYKMMDMDPNIRYNAVQSLNHPYLAKNNI